MVLNPHSEVVFKPPFSGNSLGFCLVYSSRAAGADVSTNPCGVPFAFCF